MSAGQRIGLLVVAVVVAVAAFVIAKPGDDDSEKSNVTRIDLEKHEPLGGPKTIEAEKGDRVRIVVTSDAPDEVHLHGYDIEREIGPGKPGRYAFKATLEGAFDMESHETEDKIATVQVKPR